MKMSDSIFIKMLKYRQYWDYNTILVIVGGARIGKSWCACGLAELLDPNFNKDKIIFSLKEFLKFVKSGKSCWLVFDEVGVTFSAYEWWSIENRIFGHVTEAFGKLNINLILTLPSISMLSKQGLAMTHYFIEMKRRGIGRIYLNYTIPIMGKRRVMTLGHLVGCSPTKKLWDSYEEKKMDFLNKKSDEWESLYKEHQLKGQLKAQRIISRSVANEESQAYDELLSKELDYKP